MKTQLIVCLFFLIPVFSFSQKKMISFGASAIANDIINSTAFGYSLQFEQQFDDRWTFCTALNFCADSVNGVSTMFINGVEKADVTKYRNNNLGLETAFRYHFHEALNGLFIGPTLGIQNFDIIRAFNNNGDLGIVRKRATAFSIGVTSGVTLKIGERMRINLSGCLGQAFIRASGYGNNLMASGSAGMGYIIYNKKPKRYWE